MRFDVIGHRTAGAVAHTADWIAPNDFLLESMFTCPGPTVVPCLPGLQDVALLCGASRGIIRRMDGTKPGAANGRPGAIGASFRCAKHYRVIIPLLL